MRNPSKSVLFLVVLLTLSVNFAGCDQPSDDKDSKKTKYTLTFIIEPVNSGTAKIISGSLRAGHLVTILAEPASGWEFDRWETTNDNSANPTTVAMYENKEIVCHFKKTTKQLTMIVSPPGSGTISPDSGTYPVDSLVTLTATPAPGYEFDHWEGTNLDTINPTYYAGSTDKTITCYFKAIGPTKQLTTAVSPLNSGTISPASGTYPLNTVVTLTATPASGYVFDHWEGADNNTSNPTTATLNDNKLVTCYFKAVKQLTTAVTPLNSGTISPASGTYPVNTVVTLTATPAPGYEFDQWSGTNNNTANPTTVTLTDNKTIVCYFKAIVTYKQLTTAVSPLNSGTILPVTVTRPINSVQTLTATPASGYVFDHWEGADNNTVNPTTVTLTDNKLVTCYFKAVSTNKQLTTIVSPLNSGTISPASGTYPVNTVVTLTATPAPGYMFDYWSGTSSNFTNPASVTMTDNKTVYCYFKPIPNYQFLAGVSPYGSGTVSPSSGTHPSGTVVTLTATPATGYEFDHWINADNNTINPTTKTLNANVTITAVFKQIVYYNLTSQVWPSDAGTISPASGNYRAGTNVTLTATANPGWTFIYWENTANNWANPSSVIMNSALTVKAHFLPTYLLRGINFSPFTTNVQPSTIAEADLRAKLVLISHYTDYPRTFSATGGMEKAGLIAHELGMRIAVTAWISTDDVRNQQEVDSVIAMAQNRELDMIIIGSEALLRNEITVAELIDWIEYVRLRVPSDIPITTADIYTYFLNNPDLVAAVDLIFYNYYGYWEGKDVNTAIFFLNRVHQRLVAIANGKPVIVSEAGWPSGGNTYNEAVPSEANAAFHFINFVSWAEANDVDYFYFEAFDEPWKTRFEGTVGGTWGIMYTTLLLKPGMINVFMGDTIADNWSGDQYIGGTGAPEITVTHVPPYQQTADNYLKGTATNLIPNDYQIAVYLSIDGTYWWIKPTYDDPSTLIASNGTWSCLVRTGGMDWVAIKYTVYLLPANFNIPKVLGNVLPPALDANALDKIVIDRPPV